MNRWMHDGNDREPFFGTDRTGPVRRFTATLPPPTWRERLAEWLEQLAAWVRR